LGKATQYYCTPQMCRIPKRLSTERLSARGFPRVQWARQGYPVCTNSRLSSVHVFIVPVTLLLQNPIMQKSSQCWEWGCDRWCGSECMCALSFISSSRIWTRCCVDGRWPDSSWDHTGTSFTVISNAPVDIPGAQSRCSRRKPACMRRPCCLGSTARC
jgi:hypothetical protein